MAYVKFNSNPKHSHVGDCTVRAISKALGQSWEQTYIGLAAQGLESCDMPSANNVWGEYLRRHGFTRSIVPDSCPDCYTVRQFCRDHPVGTYVLALPKHAVAASGGDYFDSWDSGDEAVLYYWQRKDE